MKCYALDGGTWPRSECFTTSESYARYIINIPAVLESSREVRVAWPRQLWYSVLMCTESKE